MDKTAKKPPVRVRPIFVRLIIIFVFALLGLVILIAGSYPCDDDDRFHRFLAIWAVVCGIVWILMNRVMNRIQIPICVLYILTLLGVAISILLAISM